MNLSGIVNDCSSFIAARALSLCGTVGIVFGAGVPTCGTR